MRSLFIVLGFITAVSALILAVTPFSKTAYIPAIGALLFGGIAFYISKQKHFPKKSIQLIFLLTVIALVLTTYKTIFNTTETDSLEELELKEESPEALDTDDVDSTKDELPYIEGMENE